jgi:hypothetical protein
MNIQVVSAKDGRHELIVITEPMTIVRGAKLNRLICEPTEHWFKQDGTYDGWGMNCTDMTPEQIKTLIDVVEKSRVFP